MIRPWNESDLPAVREEERVFRIEELERKEASAYEAVLMERARWLDEHGLHMWKPEHLSIDGMIERYGKPAFFGAFEGPDCAGGFALLEEDERYWPGRAGDRAFYIHKFVVSPRFAGKGYADRMLEWSKDLGRQRGKDFVRLDYTKQRSYLRSMYLRHGFEDAGESTTPEGTVLVLGECRLLAQ